MVDGARKAVTKFSKPLIAGGAAAAGVAGGLVLGSKARSRKRRFGLGGGMDLSKATKQVGKAAQQFSDVTKQLSKAGEQAEKVGKRLS